MFRVDKENRTMEQLAFGTDDCSDDSTVVATTPCECNGDGANSTFVVCTDVPARRYEVGYFIRWVDANSFFAVQLNACVRENGTWVKWRKYDIDGFVTRTVFVDAD